MSIFVPEDVEPKTQAEKVMASVGIKNADKEATNITIGVIGTVLMCVPAIVLVISDVNILKRHLKMMWRNLREGWHHVTHRGTRVAPKSRGQHDTA